MDFILGFSLRSTLWDELVNTQSRYAASGFIHDVFDQYVRNVNEADDVRSRIQEDLLHILDDNDGRKLREWLRAFKEDPAEFAVKSTGWADLCCERA